MQHALDLEPLKLDRPAVLGMIARQMAEAAIAAGERKAAKVAPAFTSAACAHILAYLKAHGRSSGELLTDSCKLAGIKSSDDRHFGAVFQRLLRDGAIQWVAPCKRIKGHASRGGSLYELGDQARGAK